MLSCVSVSWISSRICRQCIVGASFNRRLISCSVAMICAHTEPIVDVLGSWICNQKHYRNIFCGSGLPDPSIRRCTHCRSQRRFNHIPIAGLHSLWPILNLLQWFSKCNMYSLNSSSHAFINSENFSSVRCVVNLNITSICYGHCTSMLVLHYEPLSFVLRYSGASLRHNEGYWKMLIQWPFLMRDQWWNIDGLPLHLSVGGWIR